MKRVNKVEDQVEQQGAVQFSVKELFVRTDQKLDQVIAAMNSKADREEISRLEGRVDTLEKRGSPNAQEMRVEISELRQKVSKLETEGFADDAVRKNTEAIAAQIKNNKYLGWGLAASLILAAATLAGVVFALLQQHR